MAGKSTYTNLDNVALAAKVFDEHGDHIRRIIYWYIQDEALADDLFQDFFLTLVDKPVPMNVENIL